ncbi:hypothetical protein [Pseudomonas taiwanensis]|uniref:hypothetical protein n=1 Tax=Pseudomonas taiwanensis TaxID=470150 RepID=UPI001EE1F773|nr:hypothetical protein [Pseudomonas taiwanensis]
MVENETRPDYVGKATVYLDQNVLDLAVKEKDPAFFARLIKNYQVVYSDNTLREIKRSGKSQVFLTALESMSAMHFQYQADHSFQPTGGMLITSHSPFQTYENYLNIEPIYDVMLAAAHQTNLKLYGGRKESSFSSISREQADAFKAFMSHTSEQLALLGDEQLEAAAALKQYLEVLQRQYEIATEVSNGELEKYINDASGQSGVQAYRSAVGVGPVQLNNVQPPNVIQKIWDMHQELDGYKGMGYVIEDFVGISLHPIYGREMHQHEKVTSIYNVLNVIGYKPDRSLNKEHRHIAAISDAAHASVASHAHILLSADTAFVCKVRAIYELLEIPTNVYLVTFKDGQIWVEE